MPRSLLLLAVLAAPAFAEPLSFRLKFDPAARREPFTGRAYVMLVKKAEPKLKAGVNWFSPEPLFAADFKGVKPGEEMVIDAKALAHPVPMAKLARGTYTVQAVIDTAPGVASFSAAPGNVYAITRRDVGPDAGPVALTLDKVYADPPFNQTARVKLLEVESKLLTDFFQRPTALRAG
ncbi:MAG: hypothetical protein ACRC33_02550, partial [Gemmataceae bacterium]